MNKALGVFVTLAISGALVWVLSLFYTPTIYVTEEELACIEKVRKEYEWEWSQACERKRDISFGLKGNRDAFIRGDQGRHPSKCLLGEEGQALKTAYIEKRDSCYEK